jgi:hypothetical protein
MDTTKALLVITILICGATGYYAYKTSEDVKHLKEQAQVTEQKLDSLMLATAKIATSTSVAKKATAKKQPQPKSFWEELFSALEEDNNKGQQAKANSGPKMTVSSSYRMEDRYVSSRVRLPDYLGDQEGKIVVIITIDALGDVKKTSVGSETTITDEDVIEASRKAALQTNFNYYSGAGTQEGTITYTFKKR